MTTGPTRIAALLAAIALAFAGCGLDQRGTSPGRGRPGAGAAGAASSGVGGSATTTGAGGSGGSTSASGGSGGATTSAGGAGGETTVVGGTGGGGTGARGSGGSTTTTDPTEDCFNGKDDDNDGHVDCDDPACAPVATCVEAPQDWDLVRFGSAPYPGPGAVACPDGSPPAVLFAGPAGPATCAACACSYTGALCSAPKISCWYDQVSCWFDSSFDRQADSTGCLSDIHVPKYTSLASCKLTGAPHVLDPGTCAAVGGGLDPADPWATTLHVCPVLLAKKGGGCAPGLVCAAMPGGAPYDGPLCVQRAGTDDCPLGFTDASVLGYDDADDQRACSACSCDPGTVTCTGGGYHACDGNSCDGGTSWVGNGDCTGTSGELDWDTGSLSPVLADPQPGACSGATPAGELLAKHPRKLCCRAP